MNLKGKVALVTGGSRGIGRSIVLRFAEEGADIVLNFFRHQEQAEETATEAATKGVSVRLIKANVGDPDKVDAMFESIKNEFGRLDILVNNAASGVARSALELDSRGWDWTMDINARAFLLCAQRAAKLMEQGGKIVAISSLGSRLVWPKYMAVGVSKAALEALVRYLAIELAPQNISVNAVAPGPVETEALKVYAGGADNLWWRETPAGRMVTPEDVAAVVTFLCSSEADMVRGQTIIIDGGLTLSTYNDFGMRE